MDQRTERHLPIRDLNEETFAPFGQLIVPRRGGEQFDQNPYDPETSGLEAKLTLNQGVPRLWIMHLRARGTLFTMMGRHMRVTQCLGALQGKEWLIGVAPPDNPVRDDPDPDTVVGFRVPGDCILKLHIGTWHAGPHFVHDECMFLNLENLDTNHRDFHRGKLAVPFRFAV
jgi:ureidoglycolate hydrolase